MTLINKIRFNVFRGYAHSLYQFLILVFAIKMFGRAHWGEIVGIFLITNLLSMVAQFGQKEYYLMVKESFFCLILAEALVFTIYKKSKT